MVILSWSVRPCIGTTVENREGDLRGALDFVSDGGLVDFTMVVESKQRLKEHSFKSRNR